MKIDPKYFNLFAGTVAFFALISIVFFTIRYADNQRGDFIETVGDGRDLYQTWFFDTSTGDSLRASQFADKIVVIDFWATWSGPSTESHRILHGISDSMNSQIVIIAAAVRDDKDSIEEYASAYPYSFRYVMGTGVFQELKVPGVPSQVVYAPGGRLLDVRVGYKSPEDYTLLRNTISDILMGDSIPEIQ